MQEQLAYLYGLLCGRGHIYASDQKLVVEFAHKNPTITGIAHCHKCGWIATEKKKDNPNKDLFCKNCGTIVPKSAKKVYEQRDSTVRSIRDEIIPFLSELFDDTSYDLIGNEHMTYLVMTMPNKEWFASICRDFNNQFGFDSFEIPSVIYSSTTECKTEFVNGLLDTAGFFNSGGWLNRPGKNGEARMRGYFQIVRNWKLPVQICNFLKSEFGLPIHTIDWGHPNTRDSNLKDYYDSNKASWSREHQVKFFPEYYSGFSLRIEHKRSMFDELIGHNDSVVFENDEDCIPPKVIGQGGLKPIHPGESDLRLPESIRKHHDGFCQICHNLGCSYSNEAISKAKNPKVYYLTGKDLSVDAEVVERQRLQVSYEKAERIHESRVGFAKAKKSKALNATRGNPEQELYEPLSTWYRNHLISQGHSKALVHDTSSFYLDQFIEKNNLFEDFDFCNEYKIKPDIVGFLRLSKQLTFMEVKVGDLTLKDLGQLLGYCLVAQPSEAILVSPKPPNLTLLRLLKLNPDILKYSDNDKIQIATWDGTSCKFVNTENLSNE